MKKCKNSESKVTARINQAYIYLNIERGKKYVILYHNKFIPHINKTEQYTYIKKCTTGYIPYTILCILPVSSPV